MAQVITRSLSLTLLSFEQKLEKTIPGAPENETPVHLRKKQIFAHSIASQ